VRKTRHNCDGKGFSLRRPCPRGWTPPGCAQARRGQARQRGGTHLRAAPRRAGLGGPGGVPRRVEHQSEGRHRPARQPEAARQAAAGTQPWACPGQLTTRVLGRATVRASTAQHKHARPRGGPGSHGCRCVAESHTTAGVAGRVTGACGGRAAASTATRNSPEPGSPTRARPRVRATHLTWPLQRHSVHALVLARGHGVVEEGPSKWRAHLSRSCDCDCGIRRGRDARPKAWAGAITSHKSSMSSA
jgi:hypothetical protein